jgi:hypothetical protein
MICQSRQVRGNLDHSHSPIKFIHSERVDALSMRPYAWDEVLISGIAIAVEPMLGRGPETAEKL